MWTDFICLHFAADALYRCSRDIHKASSWILSSVMNSIDWLRSIVYAAIPK